MLKRKSRKIIGRLLLEVAPIIIGSILKQFFKGGKTKLGVYLLAIVTLSINYFFDIDTAIATVNLEALPVAAKAGAVVSTSILGLGIGHDVVKKSKNVLKDIRYFFD